MQQQCGEYNALLIGLKITCEIGIHNMEVYGDSLLIVNQVYGEFEVCHADFVPYHAAVIQMAQGFKSFHIEHIFQNQNSYLDALASLATSLALQPSSLDKILIFTHDLFCPKSVVEEVFTVTEDFHDNDKEVLETFEASKLRA